MHVSKTPNGVYYDEINDRLLVVSGNNAQFIRWIFRSLHMPVFLIQVWVISMVLQWTTVAFLCFCME